MSPPSFSRVRLVGVLAVSQVVGWGTTFDMLGVMGRSMVADVGLGLDVVFLGLTLMMLIVGFTGPTVGEAIRRHGAARVLTLGSLVTGAGLGLLAVAVGPVSYFLAWVVIGLGGGLALTLPAYAAAVEREGRAARRSITILMLFTGVSSTIFWPILGALDGAVGWRLTLAAAAVLHLVVCLPLHAYGLSPADPAMTAAPEAEDAAGETAGGRKVFLLIAVVTVTFSFTTFGMAAAFLEFLRAAGTPADYALWLGSVRPVLGITARAIDLVLDGRSGPVATTFASAALMAAGFAVFMGGEAGIVAFVVFYGLGAGLSAVARAALPLAFFPPSEFAGKSGRLALPQNIANAIGPVVFVALAHRAGPGSVVVFGLALMALALASGLLLANLGERAAAPLVRETARS